MGWLADPKKLPGRRSRRRYIHNGIRYCAGNPRRGTRAMTPRSPPARCEEPLSAPHPKPCSRSQPPPESRSKCSPPEQASSQPSNNRHSTSTGYSTRTTRSTSLATEDVQDELRPIFVGLIDALIIRVGERIQQEQRAERPLLLLLDDGRQLGPAHQVAAVRRHPPLSRRTARHHLPGLRTSRPTVGERQRTIRPQQPRRPCASPRHGRPRPPRDLLQPRR